MQGDTEMKNAISKVWTSLRMAFKTHRISTTVALTCSASTQSRLLYSQILLLLSLSLRLIEMRGQPVSVRASRSRGKMMRPGPGRARENLVRNLIVCVKRKHVLRAYSR